MKNLVLVIFGACVASLAATGAAEACGGGAVVTTTTTGGVVQNTQRVVISVHPGSPEGTGAAPGYTDVITQIGVPETTADYGALLPLPSEPTLDPNPVPQLELEALDAETAPQVIHTTVEPDGGGSGCACGAVGASDKSMEEPARASKPVNIGPVTAVVLEGTTTAVNTWLGENGFVLSDAAQATLTNYAGYFFVAIRRNETAAPGGPSSVGIHFTMPDDHRELPLRFASIGAAPSVAFTLFLAANDNVAPSSPFSALTLDDLDREIVRRSGYEAALRNAVEMHGNRAFVLESRMPASALYGRLGSIITSTSIVTRMTTILPAEALTEDAHFYDVYPGEVPSSIYLDAAADAGAQAASFGLFGVLVLGWRRRHVRAARARIGTRGRAPSRSAVDRFGFGISANEPARGSFALLRGARRESREPYRERNGG